MCAFVPREERFDRITRLAKRLMHAPIALISIVEEDQQWFRSVQGLDVDHTSRDISFCGHAILSNDVFQINDTLLDERFAGNPLVTGAPFIRSYLGVPLEIAPGLRAGTLCVIDTMPRTYGLEDLDILSDLARMAEAELRTTALASQSRRYITELSRQQRQQLLDPVTGSWREDGFAELIRRAIREQIQGNSHSALVVFMMHNLDDFNQEDGPVQSEGARAARTMLIVQIMRKNLPENCTIRCKGGGFGLALIHGASESSLAEQLQTLHENTQLSLSGFTAPGQELQVSLVDHVLSGRDADTPPEDIIQGCISRL